MANLAIVNSQVYNEQVNCSIEEMEQADAVLEFKKRMLEWHNPVEYVNNMYGSHPDDEGNEYFRAIFSN